MPGFLIISGGGIDTSGATATDADIRAGKTAFLADGKEHNGELDRYEKSAALSDAFVRPALSDSVTITLTNV